MLVPILFNTYLDHVININSTLKKMAEQGRILAFADSILVIANNRQDVEEIL